LNNVPFCIARFLGLRRRQDGAQHLLAVKTNL
jgi:hypothetical protein